MDISGKTAIVTGAASGIGLGIATALAEAGANVVMADIQKCAVEQAAHGLSGTNKRVMPVRIDVTLEPSIIDALSEAEKNFGKLHIACNNAGVPMHGTALVDVPQGDWQFVMGVNIWGIIHGIRHFVPAILKHGEEGHVVNTASSLGRAKGPPICSGRLRAPRAIFVLIGPGHNTETPTLVPSSSCSSASVKDRAAYFVIEYGP